MAVIPARADHDGEATSVTGNPPGTPRPAVAVLRGRVASLRESHPPGTQSRAEADNHARRSLRATSVGVDFAPRRCRHCGPRRTPPVVAPRRPPRLGPRPGRAESAERGRTRGTWHGDECGGSGRDPGAATLPAGPQDRTAGTGTHTRPEPVLLLALAVVGLEGALHREASWATGVGMPSGGGRRSRAGPGEGREPWDPRGS